MKIYWRDLFVTLGALVIMVLMMVLLIVVFGAAVLSAIQVGLRR